MTNPVPWVRTFTLEWRPTLTFSRRRLEFLDWANEHLDPSSFLENENQVGVALASSAQRIRVDRHHLHLEMFDPDVDAGAFARVVEQIYAVFEPEEPEFLYHRGSWSAPLSEDYDAARRRLAARAAGPTVGVLGEPFDCAILVDQRTEVGVTNYEFGVVTAGELEDRLTGEQQGRLNRRKPGFQPAPVSVARLADLAAGSSHLFVDSYWDIGGLGAGTPTEVMKGMARVGGIAAGLVSGLQSSLQ